MPITLTPTPFAGWDACLSLATPHIQLILPTEIGPRLLFFGPPSGLNALGQMPAHLGHVSGDDWRLYGGHRLWHAPEAIPRTYQPDNAPITATPLPDGGLRLTQPIEPATGIAKQLDLHLHPTHASLRLIHTLTNHSLWPVTLAPWAITVMAPGGTALLPLPPRRPHPQALQADSTLVVWAYTDLSDPRYTFSPTMLFLRHDPTATSPQKIGLGGSPGWLAYSHPSFLFIKTFTVQPAATYPDRGASGEVYTDASVLELESLAPLTTLAPGESATHTEYWWLFPGARPIHTPADLETQLYPHLSSLTDW